MGGMLQLSGATTFSSRVRVDREESAADQRILGLWTIGQARPPSFG